jgi:hypothetical protein
MSNCTEEDEVKKENQKEINSRHECQCMPLNDDEFELVMLVQQPVECQSHQSREAQREAQQEAILQESLYRFYYKELR